MIVFSFVACKNDPVVPEEPKVPENAVKVVDEENLVKLLNGGEEDAVIALDEDIKLTAAITVKGTKTLYLNDHVLDLGDKVASPDDNTVAGYKVIRGGLLVDNEAKLTINGNGEVKGAAELIAINDTAEVIINGCKFSPGDGVANIRVRGKLTINDGELHSKNHCCLFLIPKCDVTVNGGKLVSDSNTFVININGSIGEEGIALNITGGEFYGSNYFAGNTTTTISGGLFKCTEENIPIYIKSGWIKITGGEFIGPAYKDLGVDYIYWGNGTLALYGDIVLDSCGYPGGAPTVDIAGAKLTSGIFKYVNPEQVKPSSFPGKLVTKLEHKDFTEFSHKRILKFSFINDKGKVSTNSATFFFTSEERANNYTEDQAKTFLSEKDTFIEFSAPQVVVPKTK